MHLSNTTTTAKNACHGGVKTLVVLAVLTLVIVGVAIGLVMNSYQRMQPIHHRKALMISDYGLQLALERLIETPSVLDDISKTPYLDGWYKVTMASSDSASERYLTVSVLGHAGNQTRTQICRLRLAIDGVDSIWVQQDIRQE